MAETQNNLKYLQWLLLPLARFCLRKGYAIQHFNRVAKIVFVQAAREELERNGLKINASRISALSGVTRDEANRIEGESEPLPSGPITLLGRVLAHWEQDEEFQTARGQPKQLTLGGEESEFYRLVSKVSKHLNPGTVLFELERSGAVERRGKRVRRARQLVGNQKPEEAYRLLAAEVQTLITCVEQNVTQEQAQNNLHVRTEYDNVFVSDLPQIRKWLIDEGKTFHRKLRNFLAKYDRDISPKERDETAGGRVVVSVFSTVEGADNTVKT
ncbi:MAG: hypothetical protein KDD66_10770, partial [Bdellovibrionales bacterium]|nr:hypothetical protein [Bdellovibrionales bacterium]